MEIVRLANKRNILFITFSLLTLLIFYTPSRELLGHIFRDELYSHMIVVPFVSGYFIFLKRKQIFLEMDYSFKTGVILLMIGISLYFIGEKEGQGPSQNNYLSLMMFSALTFWIGGFVIFYGVKAFKIVSFALLFLLFMVPIPGRAVEVIIYFLQCGSAEAAYGFFKLIGIPVLREGFTFHLPGISIGVAEQCSGIRSSIALFVAGIVAGQLFLRTGWKKVVLVLSIIPITMLKNGMRIVTLSLLGIYIDQSILSSDFHRRGGIPFFIVALALLTPVLWWLRRTEKKHSA